MPAALSPGEPSARTWWSLSKAPSSKDLRQAYAQEKSASRPPSQGKSGKLNSFASAIGFKSKKLSPSLAIQDPPATISHLVPSPTTTTPTSPVSNTTRPPSKSDSCLDFQRERRHSLLTLSDTDPFAGRPIIAVPVPHLPSDSNRLSAYSNTSVTDFAQKKTDIPTFNRVSYASSSSNSNNHAVEIPASGSTIPAKGAPEYRQLNIKRSMGSLQVKRTEPLHRQTSVSPSMTSSSNAGSSSTLIDSRRPNQIDSAGTSRPKMRARGMTDTGASQRAGFFVEERPTLRKLAHKASSSDLPSSPETSTSPRVVIRQASVSRLHLPPSAPPTHSLPAPPPTLSPAEEVSVRQKSGLDYRMSASSSSISFASSESLIGLPYGLPDRDKRSSQRSAFSQNAYELVPDSPISFAFVQPKDSKPAPNSPRTLKKALSHQSLRHGHTSPLPAPKTLPDSSMDKAFRKQRNFHHPRLPIPPIPLPLPLRSPTPTNSGTFPSMPEFGNSGSDRRRGSTTSTSSRKRLFSSSSRPSTSHHPPTAREDDTLSVFSLRSDNDSHLTPYKPWLNTSKSGSSSSFWDEGASDHTPSSPIRPHAEYTPQAIMSRAELARLEASVDNCSPERSTNRNRGLSILSTSTMLSNGSKESDFMPAGLSPPPASVSRPSSKQMALRMSSSSFTAKAPMVSPRSRSPPPSSMSSSVSQLTIGPYSPSTATMTSLPPPPRRRKTTLISEPDIPEAAVAAAPTVTTLPRVLSIQKPPSIKSKSTIEKSMHRRSILRKPSFLDIDDDTDQETERNTWMNAWLEVSWT
ncbi:hypothetical protein BDZ97DRAFT_1912121 [Flammula alnicola]|nr:hypothetical protein BDZ97DRAFT_1912121 [Flammula alnicola]